MLFITIHKKNYLQGQISSEPIKVAFSWSLNFIKYCGKQVYISKSKISAKCWTIILVTDKPKNLTNY